MSQLTTRPRLRVSTAKYQSSLFLRDRSLKLTDLPSWAPDWSIYERYRPTRPISSWTADGQSDIFNASGSFPARVDISADLRTIRAQGLRVGKISAFGTHLGNDGDTEETPDTQKRMFTLFQTWWRLARIRTPDFTPSGERRFDTFWRTIITNINSFCQKATQSEEGAEFRSWMAVQFTAFEPEDLVAGSLVQENLSFVASFQQATRNRRFFVTEEGHMGLGPRWTKPGDLVWVLLGSQVPFILRAVGDWYVLVGDAIVTVLWKGKL